MKQNSLAAFACACLTLLALPERSAAQDRVNVVTTLPTYGSIAREIVRDHGDVQAIGRGDVNPHFVDARPSFAALIRRADLFVTTGLDLELWVPGLLDRSNNARVMDGAPGQVVAYSGVHLLEVPENASRTGGDVHMFGNPHIHTDPINGVILARNITDGLNRVSPGNSAVWEANFADFRDRVIARLYGDSLTQMLGAETLFELGRSGGFWDFAASQSFGGRPLVDYLGGWLAEAAPFRGGRMVCYHLNWAYFSARFQVECAMFVERLPGIPPSPGHVREVVDFIRSADIPVIFAANYYSRVQVERVGARTGAEVVMVPFHEGGEEGVDSYFELVDTWVSRLAAAFTRHNAARAGHN